MTPQLLGGSVTSLDGQVHLHKIDSLSQSGLKLGCISGEVITKSIAVSSLSGFVLFKVISSDPMYCMVTALGGYGWYLQLS